MKNMDMKFVQIQFNKPTESNPHEIRIPLHQIKKIIYRLDLKHELEDHHEFCTIYFANDDFVEFVVHYGELISFDEWLDGKTDEEDEDSPINIFTLFAKKFLSMSDDEAKTSSDLGL